MNKIWFYMIISALLTLLFCSPEKVLENMIFATSESFSLCLNLLAVYTLWLGILEIVDKSGLSDKLASLLSPITKFLFKTNDKETQKNISLSLSTNMLGLGNASTPLGIEAMKRLDDKSGKASFGMIMLIVITTTSIQILPTTTIGILANAGSKNPSNIILPSIISTIATTGIGICLVFLFNRFSRRKK